MEARCSAMSAGGQRPQSHLYYPRPAPRGVYSVFKPRGLVLCGQGCANQAPCKFQFPNGTQVRQRALQHQTTVYDHWAQLKDRKSVVGPAVQARRRLKCGRFTVGCCNILQSGKTLPARSSRVQRASGSVLVSSATLVRTSAARVAASPGVSAAGRHRLR